MHVDDSIAARIGGGLVGIEYAVGLLLSLALLGYLAYALLKPERF